MENQPKLSLKFEPKSTEPEKDSASLQDRIQHLLSLTPGPLKKDKFASTNIVNPTGDIKRKLNKGYFDPSCILMLGSERTPGYSYYHSYFNIAGVKLSDYVLHVYGATSKARSDFEYIDISDAMYVVHSHAREEYCPWKGGCHVFLDEDSCRVHEMRIPNWFKDMWKELYDWSE